MDALNELSYKPPPEFEEVKKDSLVNILTLQTQLKQVPFNIYPTSHSSLGHMHLLLVSCRAQDPDAVVFLSSESEPKIGSSSKSTMRKRGDGRPAKSNDQSVQDSGKSGRSALTAPGSFDHSRDQKSKKKRKTDG
ncbi:hypothetical protein R3W88_000417 [Solanum pinnatisectum]|uniref:Uncharacterized protein n=1 Tax=Solanum pinnatisectum TaxID=50273 RepID=A0AAV9MF92_9SOLN|nr:hypothetical protein R3W88_000417 [Solanum pinnatisectum]